MKILTSKQMNEVDRLTSEEFGISSLLLMENAGMNLYWVLHKYFPDLQKRRTAVLCGKGNNGGDGLVLARQLAQRNYAPDVYLLGNQKDLSGNTRANLEAYLKSGQKVNEVNSESEWQSIKEIFSHYEIIVDALLGTGISKPLEGLYLKVASTIDATQSFVLSVDLPSGMFSDSMLGGTRAVQANATVTFTAPKIAHILNEDQQTVGQLHIVPIGTPSKLLEGPNFYLNLMTREMIRAYLPRRKIKLHKGNLGHVGIISGSRGMSGAAVLAGMGALRTGSGLVTLYTPSAIQDTISSFQPELMTKGLGPKKDSAFSIESADELFNQLDGKNAAALGPGIGSQNSTIDFVHRVVRELKVPLVLDADGLNAFKNNSNELINNQDQPLVLTPHPGEFSRLIGLSTATILANKIELARQFALDHGVWLVLKSFRTLIAEPEGQVFVCPLGNPGMASAGMGDVLTGVLTSLLGTFTAQGMTQISQISQAIRLGVYIHSMAGDLAEQKSGPEALTASDVISCLGKSFQELSRKNYPDEL